MSIDRCVECRVRAMGKHGGIPTCWRCRENLRFVGWCKTNAPQLLREKEDEKERGRD